jgi:hypothetical protein
MKVLLTMERTESTLGSKSRNHCVAGYTVACRITGDREVEKEPLGCASTG